MTGVARASYRLGATLPAAKLIYTTSTTTTTTTTTTTSTTSVSSSLDLAGHAHLTGHVTGSAKSRDEAMDVVVAKIISLLILTVLSVLCGLLPLRLLIHTPHIFSKNRKPVESFLCGLRLFSGGIYLATCFLHLLPDTRVKVAAVMVNMGSRSTYAIPELLVISGFYAVVFMEQIIKTLYVRAESSDSRRKKRPKRRKIREVYTSTLDERDGHRSGDRFELKDEYSRKTRSMYDDDSDMKGDDDDDDDEDDDDEDDENNVLVDDDDDDDEYIMESDAESDRYSQRSYTCVKKRLDDKESERNIFQRETLPRTQRVYQVKSDSYSYKDLDKRNSHEYDKDFSTTVSVHVTAPTVTSSPAVILSSITPCANKTTPTPSSYFLPSSQSSTPAAFTSTTSNSKTATIPKREVSNPEQSFIFPPVSNSKTKILSVVEQSSPPPPPPPPPPSSTAHIFPSICHANNGCDNIDNTAYKQKSTVSPTHNAQIPTRFCHNREYPPDTDLIQKHQPYSREALNDDVNDKTSRTQKPIYPLCTQSSNPKGTQPLSQYPKFTEPSVQYICDDKIRIHENHVDHENRVDHESIVPPSDFLDRENTKSTCGSSRDKDNDSGIFSSKRDGDEKFLEERRRLMMTSSDNSIDRISECACSMQEFQVQQVVDELKHPEVSTSAHLRSIIYIMALAFHGIFEGMALGLQSMKNSVWALCFAIVVHRCVLAFKLGMDLCRGEEKQGTSFLCIGTFTLISALGIIIGILISSGASFYSDVSVPEAILQSLATGTIIYIVFLDILIKDLQGKDDLKRVSCTFVGFSLMAVVFAVSGS